ncbi:MAG TPA: hypothetical protein VF137_05500 [Candidatus Dormibacteraeota bacterium]
MLARRILAGAVLGALAAAPTTVLANSGNGSLTVQPNKGLASATFTATFIDSNQFVVCPAAAVTFYWDNDPGNPIGQASFGSPDGNNNCYASLTTKPPAGSAAGAHQVIGDDGIGDVGNATYTIQKPPTPSPSPTHRPSPSPSPSHSPSPQPSPQPKPSPKAPPPSPTAVLPTPSASAGPGCTSFPPGNPIPDYLVVEFDGLTGDVQSDPFEGWIELTALAPQELLPPRLGHAGFPQAVLTFRTNSLARDLTTGRRFNCVLVSLGPSQSYFYARYVFEHVEMTGPNSFRYDTVYYDYLPRGSDGLPGVEDHGQGRYQLVAAQSGTAGFAWQWVGAGVLVLLGLSGTALARRRV